MGSLPGIHVESIVKFPTIMPEDKIRVLGNSECCYISRQRFGKVEKIIFL